MVKLLGEEFAAVADLCRPLDEASWSTPTCLPGWTVKDQLSHLVGTERMLAGEAAPRVIVPEADYLKNDLGRANEIWVEANRPLPGSEVLAQFEAVTADRLQRLGSMTQADFDAPSWTPVGRDETYGRFMRIRHYDCFLHEHDIRQALAVDDRDDEAHVRSALEETAAALGYIAGRRAALPTGTTVRIEVVGAAAATYLIAVDERARLVAHLDAEPTTGIRLPAMLFLRLTAGRCDATPHLGSEIAVEGDETLAMQLATHLAYTI
jgi:uncharacterized protein (TIGR03083 family)